jgi:two-component system sensor histidine kinase PilS (NtrC family)
MSEDTEALKKKIKALIIFRALCVTLFFSLFFFFKGYERFPFVYSIFSLIGFFYVATIIYSLLIDKVRNLFVFSYIQLILDVFSAIALIYLTGGTESLFSFTLVLTIISASIVMNKRAGFIIATLSSILYGALINLQVYDVLSIKDQGFIDEKAYFYKTIVHVIFFYLTAYLSGYLSSRLEKTVQALEEKDLDLRNLEFFNREVIESMPSGLFTTDMSGKVLLFNPAAEKIFAIKRDFVIGRKIDTVLSCFSLPFNEGRTEETVTIGGARKKIGLTISPLKGAAEDAKGFIVVFQDLTQIKRLEMEIEQKERWAAIGELSSNIAHEIRNPLASLKGSIEILKEDNVPRNYKEKLMDIALSEMNRLNRIITDFLTYSRPSPPEIKRFDIHRLLDETSELLNNVTQDKKHVDIKKNYSDTLEVDADPQKIRQVFWNLGINAIDAMPDGGELIISSRNKDGFIEITFQDSGMGIEAENIGKIFYPFFTTKEQGTGLGLAIAYRIVEEHKGRLSVKGNTGIGTTFEIILPKDR